MGEGDGDAGGGEMIYQCTCTFGCRPAGWNEWPVKCVTCNGRGELSTYAVARLLKCGTRTVDRLDAMGRVKPRTAVKLLDGLSRHL